MSKRPPPESIAWLHHAAAAGQADARLMLAMLERIEALEATQREAAMDELRRASADLQSAPESAPVATDMDLEFAYGGEDGFLADLRAVYNLGREHGAAQARCPHIRSSDEGTSYCALAEQTAAAQPTPPAAPAGRLVERVSKVIAEEDGPPELWHDDARAAIREVAAWLDQRGQHGCSLWLREEANR